MTSTQVVSGVVQFIACKFFGLMIGMVVAYLLPGWILGNKPFDDYRLPAVILVSAAILLVGGILAGVRRIWFLGGLLFGLAIGSGAMGVLFLVYTYMHFL